MEDYENEDYENENEYENEYEYEYENDDEYAETVDQNKVIKEKNHNLDEIVVKSKLFEEQIGLFKKIIRSKRVFSSNRLWW